MIQLILAALRHRRAQALTTLVLTTFAVAAAVASPWYVAGAADEAAAIDLANASQRERLIAVTRSVTVRDPGSALDPIAAARGGVVEAIDLPGAVAVAGAAENVTIKVGTGTTNLPVAYRDDMCAHLKITGSCPTKVDEVVLSTVAAERLGFRVGDKVIVSPPSATRAPCSWSVPTTTSSRPADTGRAAGTSAPSAATAAVEPMFIAAETFGGTALDQITVTEDLRLPDQTLRGASGARLGDRVAAAAYQLNLQGYSTEFLGEGLANRVALDQDTIRGDWGTGRRGPANADLGSDTA